MRDFAKALPIRLFTPGRIGNWVAVGNIGLREATGDWACFFIRMIFGFRAGWRDFGPRWRVPKARLCFTMPCSWVRMDEDSDLGPARFRKAMCRPIDS